MYDCYRYENRIAKIRLKLKLSVVYLALTFLWIKWYNLFAEKSWVPV